MPRPSEEASVRARVAAELLAAEQAEPGRFRLSLNGVAKRTGISRTTLRKYGLDTRIREAAQRQAGAKRTQAQKVQAEAKVQVKYLQEHVARVMQANEALLAQIALAEGNAQRLGIDPSELWRPIATPDRTTPWTPRRVFGRR
jgi:hypothetical protein